MARAPVANLWQGILPAVILMVAFFLLPIFYTLGLSLTVEGKTGLTLANYQSFLTEDRPVSYTHLTLPTILLV